jgi:hypothetical protein
MNITYVPSEEHYNFNKSINILAQKINYFWFLVAVMIINIDNIIINNKC